MMRWNGFGRSLAFGALAGAGLLVAHPITAPIFGPALALRLYLVGAAVLYAAGLSARPRTALAAGALGTGLAIPLLALPLDLAATATGAAVIVGLIRSGMLYRARPLRACAAELVLQSAGLGLAGFLFEGGLVSVALAVWGYLLVQSVFFLIGGMAPRRAESASDPFDRARAELLALLR